MGSLHDDLHAFLRAEVTGWGILSYYGYLGNPQPRKQLWRHWHRLQSQRLNLVNASELLRYAYVS
jgi:hypothetical protein